MSKLADIQLTKLYYSIGEVADIFDVNTSLIRFWEKEFTLIQPKKSKKGNRLFTVKDIELFNKIYQLVKEEGYTLEGAKKAIKSKQSMASKAVVSNPIDTSENHSSAAIIEKLQSIKSALLELKKGGLE